MHVQSDTSPRGYQDVSRSNQPPSASQVHDSPLNRRQRQSSQYDVSDSGSWSTSQGLNVVENLNHWSPWEFLVDASNSSSQAHSPQARLSNDPDGWQTPAYPDTMHELEDWSAAPYPEAYRDTDRSLTERQYENSHGLDRDRDSYFDLPSKQGLESDDTSWAYNTLRCSRDSGSCQFPSHNLKTTSRSVAQQVQEPLSVLSSLGRQFVHIPPGHHRACKMFVEQHPEIVDEGTAQYIAEAVFALRQQDEPLASSCLEKLILLHYCAQVDTFIPRYASTNSEAKFPFSKDLHKAIFQTKQLVANDETSTQWRKSLQNALQISENMSSPHDWLDASPRTTHGASIVRCNLSTHNGVHRGRSDKAVQCCMTHTSASVTSDHGAVSSKQRIGRREEPRNQHEVTVESKPQQEQHAKHVRFKGEMTTQLSPKGESSDALQGFENETNPDMAAHILHPGQQEVRTCRSCQAIPSFVSGVESDLAAFVEKVEHSVNIPKRQKAAKLSRQRQNRSHSAPVEKHTKGSFFDHSTPTLQTTRQSKTYDEKHTDCQGSDGSDSPTRLHLPEDCRKSDEAVDVLRNGDIATESAGLLVSPTSNKSEGTAEKPGDATLSDLRHLDKPTEQCDHPLKIDQAMSTEQLQSQEEPAVGFSSYNESNDASSDAPHGKVALHAATSNTLVPNDSLDEQDSDKTGKEDIVVKATDTQLKVLEKLTEQTSGHDPLATTHAEGAALGLKTGLVESGSTISHPHLEQEECIAHFKSDGVMTQPEADKKVQLSNCGDVSPITDSGCCADKIVKTETEVGIYGSTDADDSSTTAVDTEEEEEDSLKVMISGRRKSWNNIRKLQAFCEGLHMLREDVTRRAEEVDAKERGLKFTEDIVDEKSEQQRQKYRELMEFEERLTFEKEKFNERLSEFENEIWNNMAGGIVVGAICAGLISMYSSYRFWS